MLRRVCGRSMLPSLKDGQLVLSIKLKVKPGDIVIARTAEREVIKRLAAVGTDDVSLVSDNKAEGANYTVSKNDILGKVIWPLKK